VLRVWQALNAEEAPPKVTQIDESCLVWRKELNSHYRSLDLAEYEAIQAVISGASFGALCEKLQENATEEAATMQAAQYLSGWLNEGMIATF
jgi:hypothetical protein